MKNKLLSLVVALSAAFCMVLPVSAQTPPNINVGEVDGRPYLDQVYTVPVDTDPATLVQESVEKDGVTYLFSSTDTQQVPGNVLEKQIREQKLVRTFREEPEAVFDILSETYEYDQDGYTGTLTMEPDTVQREQTLPGTTNDGTDTEDDAEEPGETVAYMYSVWYSGSVTLQCPDQLQVTVRYLAEQEPEPTPKPEADSKELPAFSLFSFDTLPYLALPEFIIALLPMGFLPDGVIPGIWLVYAGGAFALLLLLLLIRALCKRRKKKKNADQPVPSEVEPLEDEQPTPKRGRQKSTDLANGPPEPTPSKMPVPAFLINMERGGTDTLDEP